MPNWDICRASHRRPFSERVAARTVVNEATGCIEWIGYRNAKGYGRVTYKGRRELVHRAVWLNEKGAIPAGICVCHHTVRRMIDGEVVGHKTKESNNA